MSPSFTMRPYASSDADALVAIYRDAVTGLGPRAYTPDQIAAWLSIAPAPVDLDRIYSDGRFTRVVLDPRGRPIGFGDLGSDGHIHFLYLTPGFAGQGIGRAIVAAILAEAVDREILSVFSDASELARPTFERAGFTCVARQEHTMNGARIHNYHMCFAVPKASGS